MARVRDTYAFSVVYRRVGVGKNQFSLKTLPRKSVLGRKADISKGVAPRIIGLGKVNLWLVSATTALFGPAHSESVGHDLEPHVIKVAFPGPIPHSVVVYRIRG